MQTVLDRSLAEAIENVENRCLMSYFQFSFRKYRRLLQCLFCSINAGISWERERGDATIQSGNSPPMQVVFVKINYAKTTLHWSPSPSMVLLPNHSNVL